MNHLQTANTTSQHGLTMVELIVTVSIIAILASIAIPSYERYTRGSNRTAAKTTLERVRGLAESYFLNNKAYTNDLTNLGFNANPLEIEKSGEEIAAGSADATYQIVINVPGIFCPNCAYEVGAIPLNKQLDDSECMTLFINSTNQKGASGPKGIKCW